MKEALGTALILFAVYLCGAASMIIGEKFALIPQTCQVSGEVYKALQ